MRAIVMTSVISRRGRMIGGIIICVAALVCVSSPTRSQSFPTGIRMDPKYVAGTRVQMRSPTTSALTVMTLSNFDVSDVKASLWALAGGRIIRLHSRTIPFIASGEYAVADQIPTPFTIGKLISCVSFKWENQNVEMLDFYTNEGHTQQQLLFGTMTKFRASVIEVDGGDSVCNSMPNSAAQYVFR